MDRKTFLKTTLLGGLAAGIGGCTPDRKTHILTLSFDDGFRESFFKVADIYESFGLRACLNVITSGHFPDFQQVDEWIQPELMGDFDDWNALHDRGHEIMPHGWQHLNLDEQPPEEAKALIVRSLAYFEEHLEGFRAADAVFNFPFNSSGPELEQFTLTKVRGLRSHGETARNPIPDSGEPFRIGCRSMGPDNIDSWVERQVNDFLASEGGWLVLNVHGLDGEGWGPMSSSFLRGLLNRLVSVDYLEIMPAAAVLMRSAGQHSNA